MGDCELQCGGALDWCIPICDPCRSKLGDCIEPYAKVPVGGVLGGFAAACAEETKRVPAIFGDELVVDSKCLAGQDGVRRGRICLGAQEEEQGEIYEEMHDELKWMANLKMQILQI